MEIRIEGVLKSWNKERGFGFITPISGGGQDIFVHVSDFACKGGVPRPGERLTFEIGVNAEGKKKALRVRRPGQRSAGAGRKVAPPPRAGWAGSWLGRLALLAGVVLAAAGCYRFAPPLLTAMHLGGGARHPAAPQAVMPEAARSAPQAVMPQEAPRPLPQPAPAQDAPSAPPQARPAPVASAYRCDGRTHCSQMTSCEEATYFLRNCPGTQMDGNNDGVPCEMQWCN